MLALNTYGDEWFRRAVNRPLPWWLRVRLWFCRTQTLRQEHYELRYKQYRDVLYIIGWRRDEPGEPGS